MSATEKQRQELAKALRDLPYAIRYENEEVEELAQLALDGDLGKVAEELTREVEVHEVAGNQIKADRVKEVRLAVGRLRREEASGDA